MSLEPRELGEIQNILCEVVYQNVSSDFTERALTAAEASLVEQAPNSCPLSIRKYGETTLLNCMDCKFALAEYSNDYLIDLTDHARVTSGSIDFA